MLSPDEAGRLDRCLKAQIVASIANGGCSFRDYRHLDGSSGRNQEFLAAYGRAGLPCRRCATTLVHATVAGRTTTFCPTCQPAAE